MPYDILITDGTPMPYKEIKDTITLFPQPDLDPQPVFTTVPGVEAPCYCCDFCPPYEIAFAGTGDPETDNEINADRKRFLFAVAAPFDTVAMTLWKDGVQVDVIENEDNGKYYALGSLANPLLTGVELNWTAIYNLYGAGCYQLKATKVIMFLTTTFESHQFHVRRWHKEAAEGTVKIITWMSGQILSNPVDYSGLVWANQYRLSGMFHSKQPEFIKDRYFDTDRRIQTIQDSIENSYTLELHDLSSAQKETFIYETLLSSQMWVIDYNVMNELVYKKIEVATDSVEDLTYKVNRPGSVATIKLVDKKKNIIKRNP